MRESMCYDHGLAAQQGVTNIKNYMSEFGFYSERGTSGFTNYSHCNCACVHVPQERTILHSILTGRGHEFGYGNSDHYACLSGHSHAEPLPFPTSQVHSQGTSIHSRCTYQQPNK